MIRNSKCCGSIVKNWTQDLLHRKQTFSQLGNRYSHTRLLIDQLVDIFRLKRDTTDTYTYFLICISIEPLRGRYAGSAFDIAIFYCYQSDINTHILISHLASFLLYHIPYSCSFPFDIGGTMDHNRDPRAWRSGGGSRSGESEG